MRRLIGVNIKNNFKVVKDIIKRNQNFNLYLL